MSSVARQNAHALAGTIPGIDGPQGFQGGYGSDIPSRLWVCVCWGCEHVTQVLVA